MLILFKLYALWSEQRALLQPPKYPNNWIEYN